MAKRRAKRKQGRPRKLDDKARRKRLLDTLLRTGSRTKAARAAGLSFQGFNESVKRDDELRAAVEEIELRAIAAAEDCVEGSVATDPLMALRILERRRPDKWSRQQKHTHKHGHLHLTIEQQRDTVTALAASLGISEVIEQVAEGEAEIDHPTIGGGDGSEAPARTPEDATGSDAEAG